MSNRFYIGKDARDYGEGLEEWIANKIPDPASGQKCECSKDGHAHETEPDAEGKVTIIDCPKLADTHLYRIDGDHVCYIHVCTDCMEAFADEDYLANRDYPVTGAGYAVTPRHCA